MPPDKMTAMTRGAMFAALSIHHGSAGSLSSALLLAQYKSNNHLMGGSTLLQRGGSGAELGFLSKPGFPWAGGKGSSNKCAP